MKVKPSNACKTHSRSKQISLVNIVAKRAHINRQKKINNKQRQTNHCFSHD